MSLEKQSDPFYKKPLRGHKIYNMWRGIKQRCYNENNPNYYRYGGRGISMCDRWLINSRAFCNYIMSMPDYREGLTLDRIDNNGNYIPSNLRWTNMHVQVANQRIRKNNTSGFRGVCKNGEKYQSTIRVNKVYNHIGTFPTIIQAAEARNNYIVKHGLFEYPVQNTLVA